MPPKRQKKDATPPKTPSRSSSQDPQEIPPPNTPAGLTPQELLATLTPQELQLFVQILRDHQANSTLPTPQVARPLVVGGGGGAVGGGGGAVAVAGMPPGPPHGARHLQRCLHDWDTPHPLVEGHSVRRCRRCNRIEIWLASWQKVRGS